MSEITKDRTRRKVKHLPYFVNTDLFSTAAIQYLKNGYYTSAPPGTYAYKEFWDEETKRCLDGYSVGGIRITGEHYFYLNYMRIKATIDESKLKRKVLTFPKFLDMDYYYFHECEYARHNGKGIIVAKSRRKGFSYKNGAKCVYQYNFFRDSTSIIGAYLDEYAQSTMDMVLEMINFLNKETAWVKRKNPDRQDHVKARFKEVKDGREIWAGYNSEIYTLTFKDNTSASIGKSSDVFLFEEAGKWPNLLTSYMLTAPVFRDGDIMIGQPYIFGTGGDMAGGTKDFAEMFYNPSKYWLQSYENIYDENAIGSECGYFIDDMWYKPGKIYLPYVNLKPETIKLLDIKEPIGQLNDLVEVPMVDKSGNSIREAAEYYLDLERENVKKSGNQRGWEGMITQYPKTPREAFLRSTGSIFPSVELSEWLGVMESNERLRNLGTPVELLWTEDGKIKRKTNLNLNPIKDFPLRDSDKKDGCIVIYEDPYTGDNGEIPYGLYIAGIDPYDQDSSTTDSLGSMFVYKTFQTFDNTYDIIVAEYTGRPDNSEVYYENVRKLLTYYNSQGLYENNLKGLKVYFEQKKCLYLLKEQPSIIKDMVKDSKTHRGFGIHMSDPIKQQGEIYLRDWLIEKRGDGEDGKDKLNLHCIPSIPLIKELIDYNKTGNFDRAIAMMLIMLHKKENYNIEVQKTYDHPANGMFFKKKLFSGNRLNSFR